MVNFAAAISLPLITKVPDDELARLLVQDGLAADDLRIPARGTNEWCQLYNDARNFVFEISDQLAWPYRSVRWLNHMSIILLGKLFGDLPVASRQAIGHAAATLGQKPPRVR